MDKKKEEPNLSLIFIEILGVLGLFFYFFNIIIFEIIKFLFVGLASAFFVYHSLKKSKEK